jgi:hypothetical protein
MPAYQVKVTFENGGVMLFGFTAQNVRKLVLKLIWRNELLAGLPVKHTEMVQLPGKPKRKKGT